MKPREREFCRLTAVYANPRRAVREAGYRHPEQALSELMTREDIAKEIQRLSGNMQQIYGSLVACVLYRLACGGAGDATELVMNSQLAPDRLHELDLSCVQEIKRTDKGIELKFCDRIKALERLSEAVGTSGGSSGGLEEAILRSAQALSDPDMRQVKWDEI